MRIASLLGAVLFAGSVWLGACGGPYLGNAVCDNKGCSCHDVPSCAYDCPNAGCDASCHNADDCDFNCGADCKWDCHDTDRCAGSCGDGCRADCHNAGLCELECGADCVVDCHDLESCSVRMISGEVHCHKNSDCDIQCVQPNGALVPADNCGKDRWRCGC